MAPTVSTATADETETSETRSSVLRTAVDLLRAQLWLVVPFFLVGVLGAASSRARVDSPYPTAFSPFPQRGVISVQVPFVPPLEPAVEFSPALLLGIRLESFLVLLGWQAVIAFMTAVVLAIALWTVSPETTGVVPPLPRIGWLFGYVFAVQSGSFALLFVSRSTVRPSILAVMTFVIIVLAVAIALFLFPAFLVLGGLGPVDALLESVVHASRPIRIAGFLLAIGTLGYVLTGVGQLPHWPTDGIVVGTIASVTVAWTLYAAILAAAYLCWVDRRPGDPDEPARAG
ncbi:hypothetical protein G6M89_13175 [Natronolimnobius sp. AArcel1]|uniref:hypothetical protein n=1 Tax=Natronolimnobius sp. AArcel1 TaxID=1679093 RepID=UPI0013EB983C|nr:hypothetical protein [Natronolimnobius sp. AArcel1]NGM69951.1 hypothetical protein [Natronolimnobius sp. AArcel1]